jgi:eukaryotic-like serine/threonine-protein kinase
MSGRIIAGRYRLTEPIGRGAMGVVWCANDELLDRDVAVKEVLISEALDDDERSNAYQRTLREARTAARLSHRGVVAIYDVAEDGGRPWIIMELIHGRSLDQIITETGPLSPRRAGRMAQQLLAALATAHEARVLHRDVKPSNVLLCDDERAVLTDFGIATFQGDPRLTQTGMVMGSPGYTAPERIRGGPATPASDLWSLGATLFTAVEGHGPFEQRGGAITTMSAIIHEDPPLCTSAGPLGGVIAALLRREPSGRPDATTASRLIADMLPLLRDEPAIEATVESSAESAGRWAGGGAAAPEQSASPAAPPHSSVAPPSSAPPPSLARSADGSQDPPQQVWQESLAQGSSSQVPSASEIPEGSATERAHAGSRTPMSSVAVGTAGPPTKPQQEFAYYPPAPPRPEDRWRPYGDRADDWSQNRPPAPRRHWWRVALSAVAVIVAAAAGTAAALEVRHHQHQNAPGQTVQYPPAVQDPALAALNHQAFRVPSGYSWYVAPPSATGTVAGFRIGVPSDWNTVRAKFRAWHFVTPSGNGNGYLDADLTQHKYPDMLQEAQYLESAEREQGTLPGYQRVSLRSAIIRGTSGAVWEFTWMDGSTKMHGEDFLFSLPTLKGRQSYALYIRVPDSDWTATLPTFETMLSTFQKFTIG